MTTLRTAAAAPPASSRSGFTLVELMVVIGIIALLAALITPAVITARTSARNAAIKAEIDMLHMAIMNYKNEYGSFPPCLAQSSSSYLPATRHLQRLFPRMNGGVGIQIKALWNLNGALPNWTKISDPPNSIAGSPPPVLLVTNFPDLALVCPSNALCLWLHGYTDNPTSPVAGEDLNANGMLEGGEDSNGNLTLDTKKSRLFDFDQARIGKDNLGTPAQNAAQYWPSGKPGSPYVYIDASSYSSVTHSLNGSTYQAQTDPATGQFLNPDTFQILCAGLDEVFGTDDDLSNCWTGTRKQYLDSLKIP